MKSGNSIRREKGYVRQRESSEMIRMKMMKMMMGRRRRIVMK